jgi:hypothetical protein
MIKKAINEYWYTKYNEEKSTKTTIRHLEIQKEPIGTPHNIWNCVKKLHWHLRTPTVAFVSQLLSLAWQFQKISLYNIYPVLLPHNIWNCVKNKKLDIQKAEVKVKLVTDTYMLQINNVSFALAFADSQSSICFSIVESSLAIPKNKFIQYLSSVTSIGSAPDNLKSDKRFLYVK